MMRHHYKPMLAEQADKPFDSENWIFEVKWDGIRAITYVNDILSIRSRNGKELRHNFPEFEELRNLTDNSVIDGEIVVMKEGKPDIQTLLERSNTSSLASAEYLSKTSTATYIVFDILENDNKPLVQLPLIERKKLLKEHLREGNNVILSTFVEKEGQAYYRAALEKSMEGIMAKKKNSKYEPGIRSPNWLKIKLVRTCDCVVFGYTVGRGTRRQTFGALILGLFENKSPIYVGKVGTGFNQKDMELMLKTFEPLRVEHKTLEGVDANEDIIWLKPEIVCQVAYQNVTREGRLRMPRFQGIRHDKSPLECTLSQIERHKLQEYVSRRNFDTTPEPLPSDSHQEAQEFVVQEHQARRLHYDIRLEKNGVLKSWAVPKGLPQLSGEKRLAIQTEDHPIEYRSFEGTIPKGQYGAGTVKIFDQGSYEAKVWNENMVEFTLHGQVLHARYVLTRFRKAGEKQWLLLKTKEPE